MSDNVEYVLMTVMFSDGCAFNIPRLRLLPFCSPAEIHTRVQMTNKDFTGGTILHYNGLEVTDCFIKPGFYIYLLSDYDTKKYRRVFNRVKRRWTNLMRVEIANEFYFGSKQPIMHFSSGEFSENRYNTSYCSHIGKTEEGATCKRKRVSFKDDVSYCNQKGFY